MRLCTPWYTHILSECKATSKRWSSQDAIGNFRPRFVLSPYTFLLNQLQFFTQREWCPWKTGWHEHSGLTRNSKTSLKEWGDEQEENKVTEKYCWRNRREMKSPSSQRIGWNSFRTYETPLHSFSLFFYILGVLAAWSSMFHLMSTLNQKCCCHSWRERERNPSYGRSKSDDERESGLQLTSFPSFFAFILYFKPLRVSQHVIHTLHGFLFPSYFLLSLRRDHNSVTEIKGSSSKHKLLKRINLNQRNESDHLSSLSPSLSLSCLSFSFFLN